MGGVLLWLSVFGVGLLSFSAAVFDWKWFVDKDPDFDRDTILGNLLYDLLGRTGFRIFLGVSGLLLMAAPFIWGRR